MMFYKFVRRDPLNNFVEHHFLWKNFCYEENPYEQGSKKSQKATFYWATLYIFYNDFLIFKDVFKNEHQLPNNPITFKK